VKGKSKIKNQKAKIKNKTSDRRARLQATETPWRGGTSFLIFDFCLLIFDL
jgi:hypothetical protein